jgi:hypothetical protein
MNKHYFLTIIRLSKYTKKAFSDNWLTKSNQIVYSFFMLPSFYMCTLHDTQWSFYPNTPPNKSIWLRFPPTFDINTFKSKEIAKNVCRKYTPLIIWCLNNVKMMFLSKQNLMNAVKMQTLCCISWNSITKIHGWVFPLQILLLKHYLPYNASN